jgi:predicted oxidoreductase
VTNQVEADEASARTHAALEHIAADYSASPEQIALAWVAMLPSRPQIVIGTNQPSRIRDAAGSVRIALQREHWYALWEAAQGRNIP